MSIIRLLKEKKMTPIPRVLAFCELIQKSKQCFFIVNCIEICKLITSVRNFIKRLYPKDIKKLLQTLKLVTSVRKDCIQSTSVCVKKILHLNRRKIKPTLWLGQVLLYI